MTRNGKGVNVNIESGIWPVPVVNVLQIVVAHIVTVNTFGRFDGVVHAGCDPWGG
jgi:hypothetical protein